MEKPSLPTRWSLSRRLNLPISWKDFRKIIDVFGVELTKTWDCGSNVIVKFYDDIPTSLTTITELNEVVYANNKAMVFEEASPENMTRDDFQRAVYIKVRVNPTTEEKAPQSAFGSVSFKGFLKQSAIFYVQPEESAKITSAAVKNKFSFWKWKIGNGYERNHHVGSPIM